MIRSIDDINRRIARGEARVLRADEMTRLVREEGVAAAARTVDVVTTGTFGPMCSSGVMLNFGQSDPPIRMSRVRLNGVEAHAGLAAVDAFLGATQASRDRGIQYGGAHVIADLLAGSPVRLEAESSGTDCYPRRRVQTRIRRRDLNHAALVNPRNAYQRYAAAVNTGGRPLHTYMGTLLPGGGNVTWAGAGELSPLANDPEYRFIGAGTAIFLGGGAGLVMGPGTQHDPGARMATLGVTGDLFQMQPEFLRPAVFRGYGCSLYVGLGVPIPILDEEAARAAGVGNARLKTEIRDFFRPGHPVVAEATYADLYSGTLRLNGRDVPCAPLSSPFLSRRVADTLAGWIRGGRFFLSLPVFPLPATGRPRLLPEGEPGPPRETPGPERLHDTDRCVHCGQCTVHCPAGVFARERSGAVSARPERCTACGACRSFCPSGAIHPPSGGSR